MHTYNRHHRQDLCPVYADEYMYAFVFAGGAKIRLEVERILCHAEDFGDSWPTQWRPDHDFEEGEATWAPAPGLVS